MAGLGGSAGRGQHPPWLPQSLAPLTPSTSSSGCRGTTRPKFTASKAAGTRATGRRQPQAQLPEAENPSSGLAGRPPAPAPYRQGKTRLAPLSAGRQAWRVLAKCTEKGCECRGWRRLSQEQEHLPNPDRTPPFGPGLVALSAGPPSQVPERGEARAPHRLQRSPVTDCPWPPSHPTWLQGGGAARWRLPTSCNSVFS